jgi:hypothetical protein
MTAHQAELRTVLSRFEPTMLARRPTDDVWSAVENIRHLLFSEQYHLGGFVPGGLGLSPMGMVPQWLRRRQNIVSIAIVGTNPITDMDAVFDEWERVHAACAGLDLSRGELAGRLHAALRHQETHGKSAVRAVRRRVAAQETR